LLTLPVTLTQILLLVVQGQILLYGTPSILHKEHKSILIRSLFNGTNELRDAPKHLSRLDIFKQVEGLNAMFGKPLEPINTNKMARGKNVIEVVREEQWIKEKYIFFLPFLLGEVYFLVTPLSRCHAY